MTVEQRRLTLSKIMRLEASRLAAVANVMVGLSEPAAVSSIDQHLSALMDVIAEQHVSFPGHMIAAKYHLSGVEYAALTLALMPHHAPEVLEQLKSSFACTDSGVSLGLAEKLLGHNVLSIDGQLVSEKLVTVDARQQLCVHPIVIELYGL